MMTGARSDRSRLWTGAAVFLYGTVVASLFTFGLYARQGVIGTTIDLNGFGGIARHLVAGDGFSMGLGPTTRRAPLYPLVGAALLKLFGGGPADASDAVFFRPLLVGNCVILGLSCLAAWLLARRLYGERTALVAAVICPLIPQSLRYVSMTEVETLMGLWTILLAYASYAMASRPTLKTGVAFGVVAGLATLTKPTVQLYPIVFLAAACWHWKRTGALRREAIVSSVVALACFAALLLPWSLRNMAVTGGQFKGISSNAPGEFLRGYVNAQPKYFLLQQDFGGVTPGEKWDPEANAFEEKLLEPYGLPFFWAVRQADGRVTLAPGIEPGTTSAMLEVRKDQIETAEAKRRLLADPLAFARKFVVQSATFWYIVETRTRSVIVGGIALVVLLLGALGAVRAHREGTLIWPVLLVVVYFNAIYAAVLAMARYSMPLFPMLSVIAAGGLAWLLAPLFRRWVVPAPAAVTARIATTPSPEGARS
jgi:4-amino-4-deoxy-L-arabinose transferase-like glycosyltransferase